jgi:hypothetical protein
VTGALPWLLAGLSIAVLVAYAAARLSVRTTRRPRQSRRGHTTRKEPQ